MSVEDYNRSEPDVANAYRTLVLAPQLTVARGMLVRRAGRAEKMTTDAAVIVLHAQVKQLLAWKAQFGAALAYATRVAAAPAAYASALSCCRAV
jgi:hypothetical protein